MARTPARRRAVTPKAKPRSKAKPATKPRRKTRRRSWRSPVEPPPVPPGIVDAPPPSPKPSLTPVDCASEFFDLTHSHAREQRAFLIAYVQTGTVTRAAAAAGITRKTHQNWMNYEGPAGEQYREAFETAKEMASDYLEEEALRRAVHGLVRYRFTKSGDALKHPVTNEPYYELEYSDQVLMLLLKANRPDKFRERLDVTSDGGPLLALPLGTYIEVGGGPPPNALRDGVVKLLTQGQAEPPAVDVLASSLEDDDEESVDREQPVADPEEES